jgi:acylpyruvate hydrolase
VRIAVARTSEGPRLLVDVNGVVRLTEFRDVPSLLASGAWDDLRSVVGRPVGDVVDVELDVLVPATSKVLCVGHNFRAHILEMGRQLPEHPDVFAKFPEALIGPADPIELSSESQAWDWEAELAVVVGRTARLVSPDEARHCIAGYTVANDISARDWQRRGSQWLLGKTFERTTPIGPWLVTADEVDPGDGLTITCVVDGVKKQRATTADLLFPPAFLVSYLSRVLTLRPGDVILTGTPGGVGAGRTPAERLRPGQTVTTEIAGLGRLTNVCVPATSR